MLLAEPRRPIRPAWMTGIALAGCGVACQAQGLAGAAVPGAAPEPRATQAAAPSADWPGHLHRFLERYFVLEPTFAVWAGRQEFDGRLPDFSEAGLQAKLDGLLAERERALSFPPASLTARQRFEREHLLAVIDANVFWLRDARSPWRNPGYYLDALDPNIDLSRPYAPLADRLQAFIRFARAVPNAAAGSAPTCAHRCRGPSWRWASTPSAACPVSCARKRPRCDRARDHAAGRARSAPTRRSTRSGRATSFSSCTRTGRPRASRRCSSATPTPKAGRTAPKR